MDLTVQPGDVWWARPDPAVGREHSGRRPVLIVPSSDYLSTITKLVLVVPTTTRDRGWLNHVQLYGAAGLGEASWAMTEQVRAISRDRLDRRSGVVTPDCLDAVRQWIVDYLA